MNKRIFILAVVVSFLWSIDASSMTVVKGHGEVSANASTSTVRNQRIYLLDWQDKKMMTTKGTFYLSTDITVVNRSGLEKEEIILQKNPPIVQINKVGRQLRVITILPNSQ